MAERSAYPSFECEHVQSIKYITSYAENIELRVDVLDQLVTMQRIDEEKKKVVISYNNKVKVLRTPLIVGWEPPIYRTQKLLFFSISNINKNRYNYPMGRLRVTYNRVEKSYNCVCQPSQHMGLSLRE